MFAIKPKYRKEIKAERSGFRNENEEMTQKIAKKGVDKESLLRYTLIVPCDTELILENDTESRRTRRLRFSRIAVKQRQSIRLMSFEA